MTEPLIILCPGQGAQHVGMGKAWASLSVEAAKVYRHADEVLGPVLGMDLSRICFEGPDTTLNKTDLAQAAIYVTSVACVRGLAADVAVASRLREFILSCLPADVG